MQSNSRSRTEFGNPIKIGLVPSKDQQISDGFQEQFKCQEQYKFLMVVVSSAGTFFENFLLIKSSFSIVTQYQNKFLGNNPF
jgi:hypothetical protein